MAQLPEVVPVVAVLPALAMVLAVVPAAAVLVPATEEPAAVVLAMTPVPAVRPRPQWPNSTLTRGRLALAALGGFAASQG